MKSILENILKMASVDLIIYTMGGDKNKLDVKKLYITRKDLSELLQYKELSENNRLKAESIIEIIDAIRDLYVKINWFNKYATLDKKVALSFEELMSEVEDFISEKNKDK